MPRLALVLALAASAVCAPSAGAAIQLGQTAATSGETSLCNPGLPNTVIGLSEAYRVPSDGVLTQIRTRFAGVEGMSMSFRVFREIAPGDFRGVATIPAKLGQAAAAIVDLALPVQAGDRLGLSAVMGSLLECELPGDPTDAVAEAHSVPGDGVAFTFSSSPNRRANVAATFEPDPTPPAAPTADPASTPPTTEAPQAPAEGAAPAGAPPIVLAPADVRCVVPRLKGLTIPAAKRRLLAAHCRVGKVRRAKRARGKFVVRRQSIRANANRRVGTRVGLTLGRN